MLKDHFEKISEVDQVPMMWDFMLKEMLPALYESNWYNTGENKKMLCPDGTVPKGPCVRSQEVGA